MTAVFLIIQEGLSLAHMDQPVHSQVQRYPNSYIRKPSPLMFFYFRHLHLQDHTIHVIVLKVFI